jgi:predicted patatin/cPLA2 family phospholipase
MIGILDVGGGTRDIYGAGIFDYLLEHHIYVDYGIGISAGSANLASYFAGQIKRNYYFYIDYLYRKEYMSMQNFFKDGSYLDFDYIYGKLSNHDGENPLDYESLKNNPAQFKVLAYDAKTGKPHYFTKDDMAYDSYRIFSASCCLPLVCKPVEIDGVPYYDGGLADPVPVKKMVEDGCEKIIVVLTKPKDLIRKSEDDENNARLLSLTDQLAADNLRLRAKRYNEGVAYAKELEKAGKALIVAPDTIGDMGTLTKDKQTLYLLYRKGYVDGEKIKKILEK